MTPTYKRILMHIVLILWLLLAVLSLYQVTLLIFIFFHLNYQQFVYAWPNFCHWRCSKVLIRAERLSFFNHDNKNKSGIILERSRFQQLPVPIWVLQMNWEIPLSALEVSGLEGPRVFRGNYNHFMTTHAWVSLVQSQIKVDKFLKAKDQFN